MHGRLLSGTVAAGVIALSGLAVQLHATSSRNAVQKQGASSSAVTVSGCVQPEKDVIKKKPEIAARIEGDEFMLTHAAMGKKTQATGTSGSASSPYGKVFRLSGDKEKDLKQYAGQRVEITGSFKTSEDAARGRRTGGATSRPSGTPVGPDEIPEISIDSIHALSGTCPTGPTK